MAPSAARHLRSSILESRETEEKWKDYVALATFLEEEKKEKKGALFTGLVLFHPYTESEHIIDRTSPLSLYPSRPAMVATRGGRRRREPRPRGGAASCGVVAPLVALVIVASISCLSLLFAVAAASRFDSEMGTIGYGANGVVRSGEERSTEREEG